MCTLTFIPLKDQIVFTSNRDEHESRANTNFPVIDSRMGGEIFFPQDPKAGGTWLATSDSQRVSILLNGAFQAHKHRPPYRKSRGLVLLDTFDYKNLFSFKNDYTLNEIEPFTIVSYGKSLPGMIEELRWDGKQMHFDEKPSNQPHIWSSSQLYSKEIIELREKWFMDLVEEDPGAKELVHFHEFGGHKDEYNNLKIDRGNGLRTISISQIELLKEKTKFNYRNLVSNESSDIIIGTND
jgi:hypothetical protein